MDNRSLARAEIQSVECYNVIYLNEYKRRSISDLNKAPNSRLDPFKVIKHFQLVVEANQ
jgi:hypothetical protein